jgi:hypothetical protein
MGFPPSFLESGLLGILSDRYSQKEAKCMPDILQNVVTCTPPAAIIRRECFKSGDLYSYVSYIKGFISIYIHV